MISDLFSIASHGLSVPDAGLTAIRVATGTFFALSGFNKLANASRHSAVEATMEADHIPLPRFSAWWVPSWELIAGTSLGIGFLSALSASILTIILGVACACEGLKRVLSYAPINKADWLDDWLYLPEVVYILALGVTICSGPGRYSIDALFF